MDDSFDVSSLHFPNDDEKHSHLLSQSPLNLHFARDSELDLSVSDLSRSRVEDEVPVAGPSRMQETRPKGRPKFSLLARPLEEEKEEQARSHPQSSEAENEDEGDEGGMERKAEMVGKRKERREQKLRQDLTVLRKLDDIFGVYNRALSSSSEGAEKMAQQLDQTDALLNQYVHLLSRSQSVANLIFDEQWQGGDHDDEIITQERIAAAEAEKAARLQREAEARARAEEAAARERERQERFLREEAEAKGARGKGRGRGVSGRGGTGSRGRGGSGVTGVRGTRASMRSRGISRAGGFGHQEQGFDLDRLRSHTILSHIHSSVYAPFSMYSSYPLVVDTVQLLKRVGLLVRVIGSEACE